MIDTLEYLKQKYMRAVDITKEVEDLRYLPDGMVIFKKADNTSLDYHITIDDCYYIQYRRTNGVSKVGFMLGNQELYLDRTIEGLIWFSNILNNAYMKKVLNDTFVMAGVNYFPMKVTEDSKIDRVTHFMGSGIFPLCLALLLPVFIYSIVYEKEGKILEIMKMNGMKMRYYWVVNFLFDFMIYWFTVIAFIIVGGVILKINVFLSTFYILQFIMFAGWGYAEIGMAFFISPFLSHAQSATSNFFIIVSCRICCCLMGYGYFNITKCDSL